MHRFLPEFSAGFLWFIFCGLWYGMELAAIVQRRLKPHIILQRCQLTTSCSLNAKARRRLPKHVFPTSKAFNAHQRVLPKTQPELYAAQRKRLQWDYPLGDDQRATWKHRLWFDVHLQKWVEAEPNHTKRGEFDILKIDKRNLIHERESLEAKLHLLLDKDLRKKYIVPAFNKEFTRNLSYFYQHLTHTKFVHGVPYNIQSIPLDEGSVEAFEKFLTTLLQLELCYNIKTSNEKSRKNRADRFLSGIVHHLMQLTASRRDFQDCRLDLNPENSMFWQRGRGFYRYNMPPDMPIPYQSHDAPQYQIRTQSRLPEFTPWMEDFMLMGEIPHTDLLPYLFNIQRKRYRNTITPGFRFKAGDVALNYEDALEQGKLMDLPPPSTDPCRYGHTQFISLPESFCRDSYEANLEHCDITDQIEEHVKAHGIMSGWTWSAALAHYMGHWMDNDIEEPLPVQTVISDGQYFAFFCYQLNTVAIDPENMDADLHQKRNICFGTPFMKLYDRVEGTDDIQLYRDATSLLLKFISNNSENVARHEDVIKHNETLEVQEWDTENPLIELQRPKHIVEKEAALELAKLEEKEKNKGLKDKIIDWVTT